MAITNWKTLLTAEAECQGEKILHICVNTSGNRYEHTPEFVDINHPTMTQPFYDGYGGSEGPAFTAWSLNRVYFPVVYDGSEWVESVARNPTLEAKEHCGGE